MTDHSRDYELVSLINDNKDNKDKKDNKDVKEEYVAELVERYRRSIRAIIHKLVKSPIPLEIDLDDLYQEGLLGLMHAVENYDEKRNILFASFASKCIENEIRTFLRKQRSFSYRILSNAISLDMPISEDDNLCLMDTISSNSKDYDPVYLAHIAWAKEQIPLIRETLPAVQWKVYHKHHLGYSYKEISQEFNLSEKDVDNIIQKIKKKVRVMFDT